MKILHNSQIHTLDKEKPIASALVIEDGKILSIGGEDLLQNYPNFERENLQGRVLLPGLTDSHIHLQQYILQPSKIDCENLGKDEILAKVKEKARVTRDGDWVLGHGWNQENWGGDWPSAEELDAVAPLNPVYLTAKSLHAGWGNSSALRRAKIKKRTRNPKEGVILRKKSGHPTGIVLENAMEMVERVLPKPHPEDLADLIREAIPNFWKMGLTGIHNFDGDTSFRALQILNKQEELQLRVVQIIPRADMGIAIGFNLRTGMGDDMLRIGSVKLFADGALGPRTAAMLEPYDEDEGNCGILLLDEDAIYEYGRDAAKAGLSLAVHAIGDKANREVLNAFSRLREYEIQEHLDPMRLRIEHVQVINAEDSDRLAELDVTASMQPIHVLSDMEMAEKAWGKRATLAYAWRTLLDKKTRLAFGSDAPVDDPNPFWGLHAALKRQRVDGIPGQEGWHPAQRITLEEALAAYTQGAAYAAGLENRMGKLAPGYLADLILLDIDPFNCKSEELREIKTSGTMVAGEWVWRS